MKTTRWIHFLSLSFFLLTLSGALSVEGAVSKNKNAYREASQACKKEGKKGKALRQCVKEKMQKQRK